MSVNQVDPQQVHDTLQKNPDAVYIDVRTDHEFKNGHVPGAKNIPVAIPDPATGRMSMNPEFLKSVEAVYPRDRKIILGCQMGGRSQRAADILAQAGYTDVSNMRGGFEGAKDPMGRVVAPGWAQLNLPVEK
jgi:rhodanese-related sulfurtransferase